MRQAWAGGHAPCARHARRTGERRRWHRCCADSYAVLIQLSLTSRLLLLPLLLPLPLLPGMRIPLRRLLLWRLPPGPRVGSEHYAGINSLESAHHRG